MSGTGTGIRHPQIDGLRMIAMLGVFYVHFWNNHPVIEYARVSLFFVVSGFLIATMLLRARGSSRKVARNFYVRRALRLMPALVLALLVAYAFDMDGIRSNFLWHLFQLTNLRLFLTQSWDPWVTAHLWSLNALEQFYVFAPLVLLFLPIQRVYAVVLAAIAIPILIRVNATAMGIYGWIDILASYDPIAGGVLLALLMRFEPVRSVLCRRSALLLALVTIFSPLWFGSAFGAGATYRVLLIPALAVLVAAAWEGMGGVAGWSLGHPAIQFVNRISYGAYVYHLPLWWLIAERAPWLYEKGPTTFFIMSGATLLVATLSWYGFERHFERLKHRFPTRLPEAVPQEPGPVAAVAAR